MKPARKLVSGRVTLEEAVALRNHAASQGTTNDALIASLVRDYLQRMGLLPKVRPAT